MNFFTFYKHWFVKTTFLRIKKLQARRFVKKHKIFFPQKPLFYKNYSDLVFRAKFNKLQVCKIKKVYYLKSIYKPRVCKINKKDLQTVACFFDKLFLFGRLLPKKFVKFTN